MKYSLGLMILAGMAGSAAYYRADETPRAKTASTAKIAVPDPGPDPSLAADDDFSFPALDIELLEPVEKMPSHFVAEREPRIHTISETDEQPFAVSEEEPEAPVSRPGTKSSPASRSSRPRTQEFVPLEPVETEQRGATRPEEPIAALELKESVEGRPISVRRIGQGRYRTLIVTGLDGRDRAGVRWCDELADALEARPDLLQQQEFVIIRTANPDGLAAKSRLNARNVDLNRNFPTKRYRNDSKEAAGNGPASEPETRAMLETMYELKPHRVVHLCSSASNSVVFVNQPAGEVADRLQRKFGLQVERLNYDRMPGSLEEFVESTWNSSVVLLQLRGVPEQDVARKLLPIMLATVLQQEIAAPRTGQTAPVSTPRAQNSRWPLGPQSSPVPMDAPSYQAERRSRPVLRRGYEELPPPPQ